MKEKIIILIIGILVGSVITTRSYIAYNNSNNHNDNLQKIERISQKMDDNFEMHKHNKDNNINEENRVIEKLNN